MNFPGSSAAPPSRPRILVVDDSEVQALALGQMLERTGFDVVAAGSGDQALKRLAADECALVVSDVRMPGMDGFALCRAIKAARRDLPVVLLTAFSEPLDVLHGLAAGADAFLHKGGPASRLASRLELALASAGQRSRRESEVTVTYQGESFEIEAGPDKMLDYLLSTFDELVASKQVQSEREAAQAGLLSSLRVLRAIGDALPASIAGLDHEARLVGVNAAWRQGSERNELAPPLADVGSDYAAICGHAFGGSAAAGRMADLVRRVVSGEGAGEAIEYSFRHGEEERWFEARVAPVEDAGSAAAFVAHYEMTSRKLPERLKDEFMSQVSHELRSPLAAVHQFLSLVLDGLAGELRPEQREYLDVAWSNVMQLETMIDDLLDVTRGQCGRLALEPAPNRIEDVLVEVSRAQALRAGEEGIAVRVEVADALPLVRGDHRRLRQVVSNLVENAIKFTPRGGSVTVGAERSGQDRRFVVVTVRDTGRGIPESSRSQVFDYFYQLPDDGDASRKGLGLGLHICKTLVEAHGGEIWAESAVTGGSSFRFTIPVAAPGDPGAPLAESVSGPDAGEAARRTST